MSLLDNDFYKLTMMYAVWKKHPESYVKYQFINRNKKDKFSELFVEIFRDKVKESAIILLVYLILIGLRNKNCFPSISSIILESLD